ncbi:hypothetical protein [Calidifontibacter indicus]|uniref:Uncharacterized protein n=1 Tax=Calidifontibacter indicus TaxID=419650 RepID=A0A3D9UQX3_9MICO|nr:hypothetical protein [Calidifontibacter indicus]REF30903.1 hypothetical protein DFJ65_1936 [Calidifontibacter indicus]
MGIGGWELHDEEFEWFYGGWAGRTPSDAASFFEGYPGLWWIAGGYAIEALTGPLRQHDDCDPAVLGGEFELLRAHARGRMQLWSCSSGMMRPVFESLPAGDERLQLSASGQVWARRSAGDPWEFDILISPGTPETWVYKRDPALTMPMADALVEVDGIRYLRAEIQLLHKALRVRPKDQADFDACLPLLEEQRRRWLADALAQTLGAEHRWVSLLNQ